MRLSGSVYFDPAGWQTDFAKYLRRLDSGPGNNRLLDSFRGGTRPAEGIFVYLLSDGKRTACRTLTRRAS